MSGVKMKRGMKNTPEESGDRLRWAMGVAWKMEPALFDVLQSVISMLCIFHSCKVVSHHIHHISGDHVCYVQVDEAELSSSAILNYYLICVQQVDHLLDSLLILRWKQPHLPIFIWWFISPIPVGKGGSLDDKVENQDSSSAAPDLLVAWTVLSPPTTCLLPSCSQGDPWWFVHLGWNYWIWWSRRKSGQG